MGKPPQAEGCPICARITAVKDFVSDHCHETGISREYICRTCNAGLGMFQDSPFALRRAAKYLERHRERADTGHLAELRRAYAKHPRAGKVSA
jgi:hypothetical protein